MKDSPAHIHAPGAGRAWLSSRMLAACIGLLLCLFASDVSAEEQVFRFPPPEFETDYQMPVPTAPAARALSMHYVDSAVLIAALVLASYLVLKQRSRKYLVGLSIFSLLYFGFYRNGCICAIGSIQNVTLALFDKNYALPVTAGIFFLAPLITALFAGRTFCAGVCPHGALQDLVLLKPLKLPSWLEQALGVLPFVYLGAGVLFAATGSAFLICRFDPFIPIFRLGGSYNLLLLGAGFIVLGMFVGRPYCRFLCPYGALLRLAAFVSKWRVVISPDDCKKCRLCEESCPYDAIREPSATLEEPQIQARDKKRLAWTIALLPVLVLAGGWLGSKLSVPASRVHPTVELAERYSQHQVTPLQAPPQTAPVLSLQRADQNPKELIGSALRVRRQFVLGGWLFGGWVGLVIGVRLIGLSVQRLREDYEPDRSACVACARCFVSCPREQLRVKRLQTAAVAVAAEARVPAGKTS